MVFLSALCLLYQLSTKGLPENKHNKTSITLKELVLNIEQFPGVVTPATAFSWETEPQGRSAHPSQDPAKKT